MKRLLHLTIGLCCAVGLHAQDNPPRATDGASLAYRDFDKVYLEGVPGTVTIALGRTWSVHIEGDKASTDRLQLAYETTEYALTISYRADRDSWQRAAADLRIAITMPEASVIRNSGNCSLSVTGVSGRYIRLENTANGDAEINGNVDELDLGQDGNGDIDATRLTARKAVVKSSGNGNVTVRVTESISGTCTGNGDIVNLGSASFTADSHSRGNGRLVARRNRD